jgi:hypothetical protein
MKLELWVATFGALLAVPVFALAQQAARAADPADPRVAVPPAAYESAITSTSRTEPGHSEVTPDKLWRTANDAVAAAPGHAGHGADTAAANSHAPVGQAVPAAASKPVDQPTADHGRHH